VETAVRIVHNPTGLVGEASERRSQEENRRVALRRLRRNLAVAVRLPLERSVPSAEWSTRCRDGKVLISAEHTDFACLLAEALDALEHSGWDVREAAGFLGCTPSQLTKFLRKQPAAFELVNRGRRAVGLGVLK
jgi:RF-1 domain